MPTVINAILGSKYPGKGFAVCESWNLRNRVIDLYGRMYEDMVEIKPDIVSILVGINDGPQAEHARHATGKEAYGTIYRMMLGELKRHCLM